MNNIIFSMNLIQASCEKLIWRKLKLIIKHISHLLYLLVKILMKYTFGNWLTDTGAAQLLFGQVSDFIAS